MLNLTGVNATAPGFVTVYPAGTELPTASNVNFERAGQMMANMVTVKLSAGGAVDVFVQNPMDVVVDVSGAYVPVTAAVSNGRLVTRPDGAFRVLDTRQRGSGVAPQATERVDVSAAGVPTDAVAVVVNLTATETGIGFWTAFPLGQSPPNASNLNVDRAGQTRAGQAIVLLSGEPAFNVFTQGGGHLIVDVAGYFTGTGAAKSTDGLFFPTNPTSLLDSRGSSVMPTWGGSTLEFPVYGPPGQVAAAAINITGTQSMFAGFVTAFPAGVERPLASNLNLDTWDQTIANHAIVRASSRGISLYTLQGLHMIADLNGWFLGTPTQACWRRRPTRGTTRTRRFTCMSPAIGMSVGVGTGTDLDAVANLGLAATWNGTAELATPATSCCSGTAPRTARRSSTSTSFRSAASSAARYRRSSLQLHGRASGRDDSELQRHQQHRPHVRPLNGAAGRMYATALRQVPPRHHSPLVQRHLTPDPLAAEHQQQQSDHHDHCGDHAATAWPSPR